VTPETKGPLTSAMVALTATTGLIEAVSYLVLGPAFTAMQTGNLLLLAFALTGQGGSVTASLASLGGFVLGVVLGARTESRLDRRGHEWLVSALLVEAALLAAAGGVAWQIDDTGGPLSARHHVVICLVAVAMGMRNVTTMRAKVPDLPTTLTTRSMTALFMGSPLGLDTSVGTGARKTARRAASVGAMFLGGLLGAWMLRESVRPPLVLLTAAAAVLCVAETFSLVARRRRRHAPTARP
jgi:uncharacterized membrane protein YoaK (UPF0700 family)